MRGRRPGKTGGVFAGIHRGFFLAENDADGRGSFAAVERSMSDRLLSPNQKMVDESGFFDVYGCGDIDKSFQPHPVIRAHLDHFHRDPVLVNPSDFRQPNVYNGLLAFQP